MDENNNSLNVEPDNIYTVNDTGEKEPEDINDINDTGDTNDTGNTSDANDTGEANDTGNASEKRDVFGITYGYEPAHTQPVEVHKKVEAPKDRIEPEIRKGSVSPMMVIMGILFVLLIGLSIYISITISKRIDMAEQQADGEYESDGKDPWDEILGGDDKKTGDDQPEGKQEEKKEDGRKNPGKDSEDNGGLFGKHKDEDDGKKSEENGDDKSSSDDKTAEESAGNEKSSTIDWDDVTWKEPYENHDRSSYEGKEYYENFEDSIDTNVSYKIHREFEDITDRKAGVCLRCSYIRLEGDIPNLSDINDKLKEYGRYYLTYYEENEKDLKQILKQNDDYLYYGTSKSIVPFNDADNISIIIQDDIRLAMDSVIHLSCVNINLTTGTILDNNSILNLPDDFGAYFRERSTKQNGNSPGVDEFSDENILHMLKDAEDQIIFFTPVGLEVGYEYQSYSSHGWITISLRDYQKYMWGL